MSPRRNEDTVNATAEFPALTTADRCDRCGAQAFVRVELSAGTDLMFCAHHGRQHEERLREIAVSYRDESDRLSV
ncbi:hypothetical protein H9L21_08890 [Aeromicrobium senzhongii]|uniref:DUF7455 domain-containing protein n=1 Tax=Aeromicrobium senzhongii TaxID=2663859 RepID=A0A8I0JZ34_9ACTN|nr:hypothetical protein [Aeromicrobium senzhongii]QNL95948.1 hypothetical protein H9L21_08890 [Aeromicrobium senzhongii]